MRIRASNNTLTINSIMIYPEFERKGFASTVISRLKARYEKIVADRVRDTARVFWVKMGFKNNHDGNYVWKNQGFINSRGSKAAINSSVIPK